MWAHEGTRECLSSVITHPFRSGDPLPGGVEAHEISGLDGPEITYYLPPHRALVFGDALLGADPGQVRVPPRSWAASGDVGGARYQAEFRPSLRRLLELPIDMLLVSHGEPVLEGAHDALTAGLEAPAWGDE